MFCGHSLAESSTSEVVCHVLCPSILALAHWKCTANKMGKKLCLEGPILLHSCFWKGQNPAKYETRSNSIIQKPYFMPSTQLTNRGYILFMSYDPKQRTPAHLVGTPGNMVCWSSGQVLCFCCGYVVMKDTILKLSFSSVDHSNCNIDNSPNQGVRTWLELAKTCHHHNVFIHLDGK